MKKTALFIACLNVLFCIAQKNATKSDTTQTPFTQSDRIIMGDALSTFAFSSQATKDYSGAAISNFNVKDDTHGSRFLFNRWVRGKVTDLTGKPLASDLYWFNYDKMNDVFLLTQDQKTIIELNKGQIFSCELLDGGTSYLFEKVEGLGKDVFGIALVSSKTKYSFYKKITTKFEKANYVTNGITQSGHNYDLYSDKITYYLKTPGSTNNLVKLELKKKAIKEAFKGNAKADEYFKSNADNDINENFVKGLVETLNNP